MGIAALLGVETDWGETTVAVVFMLLVGALVLIVVWQLLQMARDRANRDHVRSASERSLRDGDS